MLVKTGDAQILDVVNPEDVRDDDKREDVLSAALERAKKRIESTATTDSKLTDKLTEN